MPLGIGHKNLDPQGFAALRREVLYSVAADDDFYVASTSIAAATVGTALTVTTNGAKAAMHAFLPAIAVTDNSGTNLTCSVLIVGRRFGRRVEQTIVNPGGAGTTTTDGSLVIDEMVSATIVAIANNAASDTIKIGFQGKRLGLSAPIASVESVRMVLRDNNGTVDAAPKLSADFSSTNVKVADSSIDLNNLYSAAFDANDRYLVEYVMDGNPQFWLAQGSRFG